MTASVTSLTFDGNLTWPPKYGLGRTGSWAVFGLADDDGRRYEVAAFGGVAAGLQRAGIGAGDRVRVTSKKEPEPRDWVAGGEKRSGLRLVAVAVEVLPALSPEMYQARAVKRILSTPDDGDVLA